MWERKERIQTPIQRAAIYTPGRYQRPVIGALSWLTVPASASPSSGTSYYATGRRMWVPGYQGASERVTGRAGDDSPWLYRAGQGLRQNQQGATGCTIRQRAGSVDKGVIPTIEFTERNMFGRDRQREREATDDARDG